MSGIPNEARVMSFEIVGGDETWRLENYWAACHLGGPAVGCSYSGLALKRTAARFVASQGLTVVSSPWLFQVTCAPVLAQASAAYEYCLFAAELPVVIEQAYSSAHSCSSPWCHLLVDQDALHLRPSANGPQADSEIVVETEHVGLQGYCQAVAGSCYRESPSD